MSLAIVIVITNKEIKPLKQGNRNNVANQDHVITTSSHYYVVKLVVYSCNKICDK